MGQPVVLVIEDDRRYRDLLVMILGRGGYRCLLASDVERGLALLITEAPDLVILDLLLPDGADQQLYRSIRHQWRGPILFLTASDSPVPGGRNQLLKPFGATELLACVGTILRAARRRTGRTNHASLAPDA